MILPNLSGIESAPGEDLSGIDPASGEDSSGIDPVSREDESREDESEIEFSYGEAMFWILLTKVIWLSSEFMAVSFSRSGFCVRAIT